MSAVVNRVEHKKLLNVIDAKRRLALANLPDVLHDLRELALVDGVVDHVKGGFQLVDKLLHQTA